MKTRDVPLKDIRANGRTRQDMGDLQSLADSIAAIGLIHPVVVSSDMKLIVGERRIRAMKLLGRETIPAVVTDSFDDVAARIAAERDENTCRKDFTPSEAVAIGARVEDVQRPKAQRAARESAAKAGKTGGRGRPKSDSAPKSLGSANRHSRETTAVAAASVGMSRPTYEKAKTVIAAAKANPTLAPLVAEMDRTGKVDRAFKELKSKERETAREALIDKGTAAEHLRGTVFVGDVREAVTEIDPGSLDWIITDPPYPREFIPLFGDLARFAAAKLRPNGGLAVMVGQSYLPEVIAAIQPHMRYRWALAYLTPGGQSVQVWDRHVNTFWKPVLVFGNAGWSDRWLGDVCKSETNDNDKRFHGWGQSESGMRDLVDRLTLPSELICDPFVGGGTTAVVSITMGRRFVGFDVDEKAVGLTRGRIAELPNA